METIQSRTSLENIIISTLLYYPESFSEAPFSRDDFELVYNQEIFLAMKSLIASHASYDLSTVLMQIPPACRPHLNTITADSGVPAMYKMYKSELIDHKLKNLIPETVAKYGTHNPDEFINALRRATSSLTASKGVGLAPVSEIVKDVFKSLESASKANGEILGVKTGVETIDRITWGLQEKRLYILAARPSMGKSCLSTNMAYNAALDGNHVYIQALEESKEAILKRTLSRVANVKNEKLNQGNLSADDWKKIVDSLPNISNLPLSIDDTGGLTSVQVCERIKRVNSFKKIDLVIIDHLQEFTDQSSSRHLAISSALQNVRALGKELSIPILMLCQLSRSVEHTSNKRPLLSHLKESGDIEAQADVVMLMYRDSYYNQQEIYDEDCVEINIAKNRDGRTGVIYANWIPSFMTFK